MEDSIQVRPVVTRKERYEFVRFPWKVYKNDPNWVPPLIADMMDMLDPAKGGFYKRAEIALFMAYRGNELAGTIAAFVDRNVVEHTGKKIGGFGFFEVLEDYEVARHLLDAACEWLRSRGMEMMRGPTNFGENDQPGVLVAGADCPPVMLEAHTPLYYKDFLERYGMEKDHDLYAWRAFREQIGDELGKIPSELLEVADVGRRAVNVTIRKLDMKRWDEEVKTAHFLFNATLNHLPDFVPMPEEDFISMANRLKLFIDPDLALFAEAAGKPIGFCIAFPDINRVLIHLNGRLFPFNWLRIRGLVRKVDVITFKLMGVLEEYRRRGIDALLYLETLKAFYQKGYAWLDGSVTSEYNPAVNLIAYRLGAERYKHYRIYKMVL